MSEIVSAVEILSEILPASAAKASGILALTETLPASTAQASGILVLTETLPVSTVKTSGILVLVEILPIPRARYLNVETIATSFAALSIPGVTVLDHLHIPERVEARQCPILYPKPDGFVSDLNVDLVSFGNAANDRRKTITYTLTYRYLHTSIGAGRGLFAVYQDMIANVDLIISTLMDNDDLSGTIDITPTGIDNIGPVIDPAGDAFHGCDLTFAVTVFVR